MMWRLLIPVDWAYLTWFWLPDQLLLDMVVDMKGEVV